MMFFGWFFLLLDEVDDEELFADNDAAVEELFWLVDDDVG